MPQSEELRVNPDEMAAQTIRYRDTLEEHEDKCREYSRGAREQAQQALLTQNRALPSATNWPQLKHQELEVLRGQMEAILQQPAVTLVE